MSNRKLFYQVQEKKVGAKNWKKVVNVATKDVSYSKRKGYKYRIIKLIKR